MLKGGIIGLGKMGLSHAAIFAAHPQVNLVTACDTSSMILDAFKKYTNIKPYTDFKKMIDESELDFIVIATPTKLHHPMVKYALERKLHVFCEKPFSLTSAHGNELVKMAKEAGVVNQVGYHNHFIGTFRELKRLLSAQVLGDLVHFTGEAYGPVVVKGKADSWRSKPEEGGGCLFDYASHVLNLVQEVIAKPVNLQGAIMKSIYSNGVDDAVYALMSLSNNLSGVLSVNWSDETYRKMSTSITVQGKKGKIFCDATEIRIYLKEANEKEGLSKDWTVKYITDFAMPVNFYLRGEEYSAQVDYFIDNIINDKKPDINSFEEASYTDKVIEMIFKEAKRF